MEDRADTIPGFTMQSENFFLKFITGFQKGVSSKLLEYETDWYEVMEIILSRLQDEQEDKDKFEIIASRDLEYWAKMQPGGDSLNLRIRAVLEEKRYFEPPSGSRKALRLNFNDRYSTQVLFHVTKKVFLRSLREVSAEAVADLIEKEAILDKLNAELPGHLIDEVRKSYHNCWTPRFFRTNVLRLPCAPNCSCKNGSLVARLAASSQNEPINTEPASENAPDPLAVPEENILDEAILEPPPSSSTTESSSSSSSSPSTSSASTSSPRSKTPSIKKKRTFKRKFARRKAAIKDKGASNRERKSKECDNCSAKTKVSTRSNCGIRDNKDSPKRLASAAISTRSKTKGLTGLKVKIKQLHIEIETLVMKVSGRKHKVDVPDSSRRKSSRLNSLKERLFSKGRKRSASKEDIFEPRPVHASKRSKLSLNNRTLRKLRSNDAHDTKSTKRSLRSNFADSSSARKKRRHS